jgi:hypothetical protein
MSLSHNEYYFDGQVPSWLSPQYSGGGVSSAGGGGIRVNDNDFPQEYVVTNTQNTALSTPVANTAKDITVAPVVVANSNPTITPVNELLNKIKQTIKDYPLPTLAVVVIIGYLVLRKGGK